MSTQIIAHSKQNEIKYIRIREKDWNFIFQLNWLFETSRNDELYLASLQYRLLFHFAAIGGSRQAPMNTHRKRN